MEWKIMKIPQGGIAFFDSGIGGLTVLHTCLPYLSGEIVYYYGDNRRAPYGNQSPARVMAYVDEATSCFCKLQARAVVLACNTATALCVERLRRLYDFPIIGAEPAVLPAAKCGREVFVLATSATAGSERLQRLCNRARTAYPMAEIKVFACPSLAGEIEKNVDKKEYNCTRWLPKGNPSAVVLGCTHYVYVKKQVEAYYQCPVFDGNEGIARRLFSCLNGQEKGKLTEKSRDGRPLVTTQKPPQIFFLGSEKGYNKRIFEQMFGK